MSEATLVYPHQLFKHSPALSKTRPVYLVEEPFLLTHNPIHQQKLLFHKLTFDAYQAELETAGFIVTRLSIHEYKKTNEIFKRIQKDGVTKMHIVDTTDYYLEQAIKNSEIERVWYDSPLFILPKAEAIERYSNAKRLMANFYKQLRKDTGILIDTNSEPTGGKWSFDADNRKRLPVDAAVPDDITLLSNPEITAAAAWVDTVAAEKYGTTGCWLPYTRAGAEKFLREFFRHRFANFGAYEDAMTTRSIRLFHSTLSPLINVGLLSPQHVLEEALAFATQNEVPTNSLEGFVRQILGWREFIRASYESEGTTMRSKNFFKHTRSLPKAFWGASTKIEPVDRAIRSALDYGYNHHIERLMVLGNCMLLCQTSPHEVYRWFMGMYVDAYDWVMVPNVYGMSQFADGGSFATKPYISGSNYIKKMSDYPKGDWEEIWTGLYWNFIASHSAYFKSNHRLSMMPRLLEKMDTQKRLRYADVAETYLHHLK